MCNGFSQTDAVKQAMTGAMEAGSRLSRAGMRSWVEATIVLTSTRLPKGPIRLRHVSVIEAADLPSFVRSRRIRMPAEAVDRVADAIE
jgi:hypothetical protein